MTDTMQAAVLTGPGMLRFDAVALPQPGPGEVRIRLEGCGVCASNIEPFEGQPWSTYPGEPGGLGHEGWGMIDAVGEGVAGVATGDRVAALAGHSFAAYDLARADQVVKLPEALAGPAVRGRAAGLRVQHLPPQRHPRRPDGGDHRHRLSGRGADPAGE